MKYATVVDSGLWVELACRLARDGIDVNYYSAWERPDVSVRDVSPGFGLEDESVRRVDSPEISGIAIFPWLHQEGIAQMALESGAEVFGATDKRGTYLERDRQHLIDELDLADAPLTEAYDLHGVSDLARFLTEHADKEFFIKVSNFREDVETFHHDDLPNSLLKIAEWTKRLGPFAEKILFRAEEPIEAEVEVGVDTFFCGGQFLAPGLIGYEVKSKLYVGTVSEHLPPMIFDGTMALAPYLKSVGYANWFTNEMRITKEGVAYVTDVTTRCPIPPGAAMLEAVDNLTQIIENGARQRPTAIDWNSKYVVECIVSSPVVRTDWLEVRFPQELRRFVKMRNVCKVDGRYWIPPVSAYLTDPATEVISCVGLGDTLLDAKDQAKHVAESVCEKTYQASYDARAFDEVDAVVEKGVKLGIEF